jgi:hypothetical protein
VRTLSVRRLHVVWYGLLAFAIAGCGSPGRPGTSEVAASPTAVSTSAVSSTLAAEDGLFLIKVHKQYGYIDASGRVVVEPQYWGGDSFSGGLAYVWVLVETQAENRYAYIDPTGRTVWSGP